MLQLAFSRQQDTKDNSRKETAEKLQDAATDIKPIVQSEPVNSIKTRYPKLFELDEQGKSIDSIAKLTGLQRGEVQLILQLAKQEESM